MKKTILTVLLILVATSVILGMKPTQVCSYQGNLCGKQISIISCTSYSYDEKIKTLVKETWFNFIIEPTFENGKLIQKGYIDSFATYAEGFNMYCK